MNDLIITGGFVVDGSGQPGMISDIAIKDGLISEIGEGLSGRDRIDASGKVVCPGFIDIHTHYDPQVLWDRYLTPSSWHGVTSVVAGNCGFSLAPVKEAGRELLIGTLEKVEDIDAQVMKNAIEWNFETYGEYLNSIERAGLGINFGGYVGHTAIRAYVMGGDSYEREATDDEIAQMKAVAAQSLRDGALGVSSGRSGSMLGIGGKPVPSMVATQEETEALLGVVAEVGRGIAHIAPGDNYAWLPEFGRKLGRTLNWSAILTYPEGVGADYRKKLRVLEEAQDAGLDLWGQVTCLPIVQLISLKAPYSLGKLSAFKEILSIPAEERAERYRSAEWRAKLHQMKAENVGLHQRWELYSVAETPNQPELVGQTIADIAAHRGVDPFEAMVDIALVDDLETRFRVIFANDNEQGVLELLTGKGCILGLSDAGAHAAQICDAVMPTQFLSKWVRDKGVMDLETGVRKLTGEAADILQLNRGYLRVGMPADIVVMDYDNLEVGPIRRAYDFPGGADRLVADQPQGIEHVIVNGVPIRRDGKIDEAALASGPGQILRSQV